MSNLNTSVSGQPFLAVPGRFELSPAYPNPFNSSTTLRIQVPHAARLRVVLYDVRGRQIRTLFDGFTRPQSLRLTWDGRSSNGRSCPSGIYLCRAQLGSHTQTRRILLLR
ncbi:MAG: T9SS type A sorting domain-containing protein [Calditrichaeota bacterium]|nr:T9SS type A sorting domain-containing protein [Calditrichota bacterium]